MKSYFFWNYFYMIFQIFQENKEKEVEPVETNIDSTKDFPKNEKTQTTKKTEDPKEKPEDFSKKKTKKGKKHIRKFYKEKTAKGQPVMKHYINYLLTKIEKKVKQIPKFLSLFYFIV